MHERRRGERRKLLAYALLAAYTTAGFVYTANTNSTQTAAVRRAAAAQTAQVQAERRRSTLISCRQLNAANVRTKKKAERVPKGPQREFTFSLIDSLAPHQNCMSLVKHRVSVKPAKPAR